MNYQEMPRAPHRPHGACGQAGCQRERRDVMRTGGTWHLIGGHVWETERRCFVVWSYADSCDEHAAALVGQVRADVDQWDEPWQVMRRPLNYGSNDYTPEVIEAEGFGTPDGVLF